GSAVPGGGGGAVKGRDRGKKSRMESGAGPRASGGVTAVAGIGSSGGGGGGGGGSSGSGNASSAARKRVRVTDKKLGEFAVMLQPFDGDHNDICERCDKGGDLLCCDFCNVVYHLHCVTPKLAEPPNELWLCPACKAEVTGRQINKRRRTDNDGGRSASPAAVGGAAGGGRHQVQDRLPTYHGVKAENDAFRASVLYKNQTMDIGLFPTAQAAARAYDRKALSLFGDAAVCNFPADEQVEVEGVATDGTTVKGVVRSFHQWRAEMQWGNKKRHLGFFDRLDHAAHAYNRAALYTNGPETALNPMKEGYVPPPLTGRSVRVPRNKLFVQQLPLPLIALSQVEGAGNSAEYERRRQQMQGKYHVPLIGEKHQVSSLPPLPPPSRPWAGIRPGAAVAATAAQEGKASAGRKMPATPSPANDSAAHGPANLKSGSEDVIAAAAAGSAELPVPAKLPAAVGDGMDVDVLAAPHVGDAAGPAAAAAGAAYLPCTASASVTNTACLAPAPPVVGSKGKGPARANSDETVCRSSCSLPSPPVAVESRGDDHVPARVSSAGAVVASENARTAGAALAGGVEKPPTAVAAAAAAAAALSCPQKCVLEAVVRRIDRTPTESEEEGGTMAMTDDATMCDGGTVSASAPVDAIRASSVDGRPRHAGLTAAAKAVSPGAPTLVSTEAVDEGVSANVVTSASSGRSSSGSSCDSIGSIGGGAPLHQGISSLCLCSAEAGATGEKLPAAAVVDTLGSQAPSRRSGGEGVGCDTNGSPAVGMGASPTTRHEQSAESEKADRLTSAGGVSVEGWQGLSVAPPPSPGNPSSSAPTLVSTAAAHSSRSTCPQAAARQIAGAKREPVAVVAAEAKKSAARQSPGEGVSPPPARAPSPGVAGRKRKLPLGSSQSAGGSGGDGTVGGSSSSSSSSGVGSGSPSRGSVRSGADALARSPPPPPPPPPRDLTFEDVAELVWDPRSGPKPRGVAEARGPGGTIANRRALERAMWERDSTLLERVAPAHAEKAMQVLQMHRHDVERAAQMLTVRHGIHVVGLSSVRTTRNKRAEQQQQQQQQALHPSSRPLSALTGRSGGGGGGGGSGRSSGG
ncbi:unnamed protein product, partial [Scytosiphon promiscuus]